MALEAGDSRMPVMAADGVLVGMTFHTYCRTGLDVAMGLVAAVAFQVAHGALRGNFLMAAQATLFARRGSCFTKGMAAQAGELHHSHAVDRTVLVAIEAPLFVGIKIMGFTVMALAAGKSFHENMAGVAIGLAQTYSALPGDIEVTLAAVGPGRFPGVFVANLTMLPGENIGKQQLVLADQVHRMASLANIVAVTADSPLPVGFLHHMTKLTILGILVDKLIGFVAVEENQGDNAQGNRNQDRMGRLDYSPD